LIRYVVLLGLGYVLGAKAGRRRYEQIVGTYRALTSSPAAKSMIEAGRRKVADRVSPDARMVTLTEIDDATTVAQPQGPHRDDRKRGEAGRSGSSRESAP
jgi:hypothetical protein